MKTRWASYEDEVGIFLFCYLDLTNQQDCLCTPIILLLVLLIDVVCATYCLVVNNGGQSCLQHSG